MNNLNARHGNVRPDQGGNGGSRWNYVLLTSLPFLGLAVYRWIRYREEMIKQHASGYRDALDAERKQQQRDLDVKKSQLQAEQHALKSLTKELQNKHHLLESQRKELKGKMSKMEFQYKELQQKKLKMESENKELQSALHTMKSQREELQGNQCAVESQRAELLVERSKLESLRSVGPLHDAVLTQEEEALGGVRSSLRVLENSLEQRQAIFCDPQVSQHSRFDLERNILQHAGSEPFLKRMAVRDGLLDIFANDEHCSHTGQRNGKLMWVYMQHWQTLLQLHKYQRAEQRLHTEDPLKPLSK
ncbi:coiled-coil domain-containing protein 127 [Lampetra planeri]